MHLLNLAMGEEFINLNECFLWICWHF